jgi:hypothetical protein
VDTHQNFQEEFNKLEGISVCHKDVLYDLIQSMTRFSDKDRCNLDHVISTLDQIKLERALINGR